MKRFILLLYGWSNIILAQNTAGSMLNIDATQFNHPNLTQLTWKAEITEYEYLQTNFRLRIEFNQVNFMGRGFPCSVGVMIQNLGHSFINDAAASRFGASPTSNEFPALGFYFSSWETTWGDSLHGVLLHADPNSYPYLGRVFEDISYNGYSAKNIYTKQNVGTPSLTSPIIVRWAVTKTSTVSNPSGNLSKDMNGNWVPLRGTFVVWNFKIEINNVAYDVADYYLPIGSAEYISASNPLTLYQDYYGAAEKILDSEKGTVKYVDMRASDGTKWYNMENWNITYKADDGAGNLDKRFGWLSDGVSLTSSVGHETDATNCVRDVGKTFTIKLPTNVAKDASSIPNDFSLDQNFPNPFNPSTTINFSVPKSGTVTIKIFDILGKEVATLVNENKPVGNYSVQLNASKLVSGVYFYRMQAGDFVQTKKSLLLK
jgi:hypothetical protein